MATPISARKLDLLYLVFFVIHIPIMLLVDLNPLYTNYLQSAKDPSVSTSSISSFASNVTAKGSALRTYYADAYQDKFFLDPPAWFTIYIWLEAVYHLPLSIWAIGALIRDDHRVPLQLLLFAAEAGLTTLTCVAEMLSWTHINADGKWKLAGVYVPYLALALLMGSDMYLRITRSLEKGDDLARRHKTR
ncbi:MAG: sterol homeostasis protein [Chaenotheca gracillima]|nr:MAG: sterol homeostasis protein [Chaenotheca gracillima]